MTSVLVVPRAWHKPEHFRVLLEESSGDDSATQNWIRNHWSVMEVVRW